MLTLDRKKELIRFIFEGGMDFNEAIFELTEERGHATNRIRCRDLISDYCSRHVSFKEGKHIVMHLEGQQVNVLVDQLKNLAITGKWTPPVDGTSVF
jgi:hypothetical protein